MIRLKSLFCIINRIRNNWNIIGETNDQTDLNEEQVDDGIQFLPS